MATIWTTMASTPAKVPASTTSSTLCCRRVPNCAAPKNSCVFANDSVRPGPCFCLLSTCVPTRPTRRTRARRWLSHVSLEQSCGPAALDRVPPPLNATVCKIVQALPTNTERGRFLAVLSRFSRSSRAAYRAFSVDASSQLLEASYPPRALWRATCLTAAHGTDGVGLGRCQRGALWAHGAIFGHCEMLRPGTDGAGSLAGSVDKCAE